MDINDAGLSGISIEQLIKAANSTDPMAIDGQSALADLASVGIAKLQDVADRLPSQAGSQAQTELLIGLLQDQTLHALGAAWRISEGQVLAIFARLRTVRGHKATVEDVLRAVKRSAGKQESQLRERLRGAIESRNAPKALSKLLKHDEIPKGLKCPDGWELDNNGVWSIKISEDGAEERTCIAPAPMLVVGRSIDISDGETQLRVGWKRAGRWTFRTIPRATVMDARPLVGLARWDAPVSSRNASNLVQYLSDFEAANIEKLPTDKTTRHMGWQDSDGAAGFLLGQKQFHLQGDKVNLVPDDGLEQLAGGWTTDGTWDGWLQAIEPALSRPKLMLAIYASVAAPLLQVLDAPNFIVDWSGETSRGKTTALRVAASVWGCPDERSGGILYSWDATSV